MKFFLTMLQGALLLPFFFYVVWKRLFKPNQFFATPEEDKKFSGIDSDLSYKEGRDLKPPDKQ